ncbi:polysaccharide pyruvyl transferase family protein [Budviciaceae bacterium BWR-B9]|uniref:Polysaccharide pyruvyl transferase family protein n=2 Tax=Budviciaceae TaxID=1903416 RepID=A0ABS1IW07_9GAMM|nr:polysaccharide pyruvyl transferase family protein [Limnobaculum allomyrinae]MBV7693755.1 polysaccharide pyruvyl transferase family protein [Limnobaculum sp. M2-1]
MNVGDFIIMDSAIKRLESTFPLSQKIHFPTHERITRVGFKRQKEISLNFLCGTNCLNSSMLIHRQWNIGLINSLLMKKVITLGVGWGNYQQHPDTYTSLLLRRMLSANHLHSVRDSYTESQLKKAGVKNVINTSCPTMWDLTEQHCAQIPTSKAENVVFTLTDYRQDYDKDLTLIQALKESYQDVYFWVQGSQDYEYFKTFGRHLDGIKVIPANLSDFDKILLSSLSLDYIGTRLHAGIRALQKMRRSIIISVDNRAEEKRKDFNLTVIPRNLTVSEYVDIFNQHVELQLTIPFSAINEWKAQFD